MKRADLFAVGVFTLNIVLAMRLVSATQLLMIRMSPDSANTPAIFLIFLASVALFFLILSMGRLVASLKDLDETRRMNVIESAAKVGLSTLSLLFILTLAPTFLLR